MLMDVALLVGVVLLISQSSFYIIQIIKISKPFNKYYRRLYLSQVILSLIWVCTEVVMNFQFLSIQFSISMILSILSLLLLSMMILISIRTIEIFISRAIRNSFIVLFCLIVTSNGILGFLHFYAISVPNQLFLENLEDLSQLGLIILLVAVTIKAYRLSSSVTYAFSSKAQNQQYQALLANFGLSCMLLISKILLFYLYLIILVIVILSGFTFYFGFKAFVDHPQITFWYPDEPILLLLIDDIGSIRYLQTFVQNKSEGKTTILTNYINVFSEFVNSIYLSSEQSNTDNIRSVEFQDRKIIFNAIPQLSLTLILITPIYNNYLENSLLELKRSLMDTYSDKIESISRTGKFLNIDEIVERNFYYLG